MFLARAGRLAEAQVSAQRGLALAPGNPNIQWNLALVHFRIGDYVALLDGHLRGLGLLGLGRIEEVASEGEKYLKVVRDTYAVYFQLNALSLAGRHEEVLAFYDRRWRGDPAAVAGRFRFWLDSIEFVPMAAAQWAAGHHDDLAATLNVWSERLGFMRQQGYANPDFSFTRACFQSLNSEPEAALATLTDAIDQGYRNPLLAREPAFAPLHGDPDFQAQVERMTQLINAEREKLGMPPL